LCAASPLRRWVGARALHLLASLRLTLVALLLLVAAVVYTVVMPGRITWVLALPLGMLAFNLGAAVATHPAFRRHTALLAFHLALIALVLLVGAGRLTYLKGQLELSQGEWFDGELTQAEAGPWHPWRLHQVRFVNDGFRIDYAPGVRRGPTANAVRWIDAQGRQGGGSIGDHHPLVLAGYRFYTTFNKGFAPVFVWHDARGGVPVRGTIHLPAWPLHEYRQALDWTPPGSDLRVWTMLQIDEPLLDAQRAFQFRVPERHRLVVRVGEERRELAPGERWTLPQGTLVYERLTTWMGYAVFYDWTMPWLLAAAGVAVASLALHFWKKYAARSWMEAGT
jgi:cytochrome c biogenesis protein